MNDGLRLLITSTPLWQQGAMAHPLPVHVETVYTVLARQNNKWQTVLSSTDDLYAARDAMNGANDSKLFDRIVITEGRSVNRAPATGWNTIECALPKTEASFKELLSEMQDKTANGNTSPLPDHAYLVGHKQTQNFLLGLAIILAALNQSAFALSLIAFLAAIDCLFLLDSRPLSVAKARKFNDSRNWAYATLNGALLLGLLLF